MTVIAASRCSRRLTVNEPIVLAPLDRCEGSVLASWVSFWVMPYFWFSSWNCWLLFAQFSKSWTYPGSLWASPSMSWTIGGKTCRVRKISAARAIR